MRLIYLTAKKYPSRKADPFYVQSMAEAFFRLLGEGFIFLIRGEVPGELKKINAAGLHIPGYFRAFFYFFVLPFVIATRGWGGEGNVFLSYDPNLLCILIFWRQVLPFRYRIVSDWHQMFGDWRDSYVARGSDILTTTSRRLQNILSSRTGVALKRICVAYGGVNPEPFSQKSKLDKSQLREILGLPKENYLIGYIGGFVSIGHKKGLDTMIEALSKMPSDTKMVFVGGRQAEIEEYRHTAEIYSVENRCIFVNRQPFEKVIEYELAMDLLVIPYPDKPHFRDYGFPMKVWEYMTTGRPILYSDLDIMREILGDRAHSFKPEEAGDFTKVVASIRLEPAKAEEVAKRNTEAVMNYTWEARAKNILQFIQDKGV